MSVALAVVLFFTGIMLHELGHAVAMRRYGITMTEICLLGIGPKLFTFRWTSMFGETPITFRLFPIAAFVAPEKGKIEELPFGQQMHINLAGIAVNILYCGLLLAVAGLVTFHTALLAVGIIMGFLGWLTWRFPVTAGYLLCLFGFVMMVPLIGTIVDNIWQGGVWEVVLLFATVTSVEKALFLGAVLSLALGLGNTMPLYPMDGARMAILLCQRHISATWRKHGSWITDVSLFAFACMNIVGFFPDLHKLYVAARHLL